MSDALDLDKMESLANRYNDDTVLELIAHVRALEAGASELVRQAGAAREHSGGLGLKLGDQQRANRTIAKERDQLKAQVDSQRRIVEDYERESKEKRRRWENGDDPNPSATADDACEWAYAAGQILQRFDKEGVSK